MDKIEAIDEQEKITDRTYIYANLMTKKLPMYFLM